MLVRVAGYLDIGVACLLLLFFAIISLISVGSFLFFALFQPVYLVALLVPFALVWGGKLLLRGAKKGSGIAGGAGLALAAASILDTRSALGFGDFARLGVILGIALALLNLAAGLAMDDARLMQSRKP